MGLRRTQHLSAVTTLARLQQQEKAGIPSPSQRQGSSSPASTNAVQSASLCCCDHAIHDIPAESIRAPLQRAAIRRRIERHLAEARLPPGKSLDSFAFDAVPMVSKAQIMALCSGDGWREKGANLILFGPPGGGKSHLATAIGLALVENGWRVLFTRTSDLVRKLQLARRDLALESAIAKLDKYHLLILDDITDQSTLSDNQPAS